MLTLTQHTTNNLPHPFPTLEAMLAEPFPRTPQDMMQLEQQLSTATAQTADQIMLVQVTRAHEDEAFVRQAMAQARAQRTVPLVHKGLRTTSVLLLGGLTSSLRPPIYVRTDEGGVAGGAANAGRAVQAVTQSSSASALPIGSAQPVARRSPCTWYRPPAISKPPTCSAGAA